MDQSDTLASQDLPRPLSEAEIVTRLNEAEGRFTDGFALVRDLRLMADALEAKNGRRQA